MPAVFGPDRFASPLPIAWTCPSIIGGKSTLSSGGVQKRLSAILAADVAGYTRLMEKDTDGTVSAWKSACEDIIDPAVSSHLGRGEDARQAWAGALEVHPDYSLAQKAKILPYKNPEDWKRFVEGLEKAGIKEE